MPARTRASPTEPAVAPPPAYFLALTVENVRCFGPAQTLDLSDGNGRPARLTVLLGENGLGKSTLLQCLAAMEPVPASVPESRPDDMQQWIAATVDALRFDLQRIPDARGRTEVRVAVGKKLTDVGPPRATHLEASWKARPRGGIYVTGSEVRPYHEIGGLLCYGYGPYRRPSRELESYDSGDDRIASLFFENTPLRSAEAWWLRTDYNSRLDSPAKQRFQRYAGLAKEALVRLLPDVEDLQIVPAPEPGGRARVEALTKFGWVPLHRLGSGYQSHIAWVVDLASRLFERYPDSDDPLAEPAVVLVDEIDLHMHPRWQRDIIRYLTERLPNTQFIVTAHSPLIVQAAEGANLVLLRREGDHVVIDNDPVRLRNWRVDQILTSELFGLESARPPQVEGLLKERRTLLSKGRMTANDRRRLAALETEIGDLPAGESVEDSQAMEIIRRAAAKLRDQGGA